MGLSINDFQLTWDKSIVQPYLTNGIEVNNFKNLKIIHYDATPAPAINKGYAIMLSNGVGVIRIVRLQQVRRTLKIINCSSKTGRHPK